MTASAAIADLLARLEAISRERPDRVLRLTGTLPASGDAGGEAFGDPHGDAGGEGSEEPFELLIFRGFSSSITHPTAFDPDQPALPETARLAAAELLAGPLHPTEEQRLAGPLPAETFLEREAWEGE